MPDSVVTALGLHLQQIHNPAVKTAKTTESPQKIWTVQEIREAGSRQGSGSSSTDRSFLGLQK